MSHSTMTIPALYDYAKNVLNIDIFQNLNVPADIDRATLIDWILFRSAPYEALYPNPEYMQGAVTAWSVVHQRTFTKWCEALAIHYDPLNNYDRTETFNETGIESATNSNDRTETDSRSVNNSTIDSGSMSETNAGKNNSTTIGSNQESTDNDSTTTNSVSAFDSAAWQDADKSVIAATTGTDASSMQATTGSDSNTSDTSDERFTANTTHDNSNISGAESGQNDVMNSKNHRLRAFGNIGVTTSQQMLQAELDIDTWNVYEHITDMFIDEFCVLLF